MSDVTRLLDAVATGEAGAADRLLALVYDELRRLAAAQLAREKPGQTLNATALVHEAWLRLAASGGRPPLASGGRPPPEEDMLQGPGPQGADAPRSPGFANRRHFFAAAAEAMRRILVEAARRKQAEKRGGGRARALFDPDHLPAPEPAVDLLALDDALGRLATLDPTAARLVELRYFAGLTLADAAAVRRPALGVRPGLAVP